MPETPLFVDTNIFLFAAGSEHPLRGKETGQNKVALTSSEVDDVPGRQGRTTSHIKRYGEAE